MISTFNSQKPPRPVTRLLRSAVLATLLMTVASTGVAAVAVQESADLTQLSLEDLLNLEVTSVARKPQSLSDAAAAVYVLTADDIRRSGATSIPEALRMVPGVQVARIDANKWAISARGFNGRFANKLLVLIDGRTVYTPLFSGVFWEAQDTLMEDIDRIEVIRGPGATMWGANAVNGVINIITRTAEETQGGLLTAGAGTSERGMGSLRYGGQFGDDSFYRFYAKYADRAGGVDSSGITQNDDWDTLRGGLRIDWSGSSDRLTLQAEIYDTDTNQTVVDQTLSPPFFGITPDQGNYAGGTAIIRWNHVFNSSEIDLHFSHDHAERSDRILGERRSTSDIDLQHRIPLADGQDVVWGFGYRSTGDRIDQPQGPVLPLVIVPDSRRSELFSAFAQHDVSFFQDQLRFTTGAKFEHNDFTGFEIQPNLRMQWAPNPRNSIWAAVSRAVRTPSRTDDDVEVAVGVVPPLTPPLNPSPMPAVITAFGSQDLQSEDLVAFEGGYRVAATQAVTLDIAGFYNRYSDSRSTTTGTPFPRVSPVPHLVVPLTLGNNANARAYGLEFVADARLSESWRVTGSYSYLHVATNVGDGFDAAADLDQGISPTHQGFLRSSLDLGETVEFDASLRLVGELAANALQLGAVPGYVTADLRLGWQASSQLELSVNGQNLLQRHHPEFQPEIVNTLPTEVPSGIYGKLSWSF